MRSSNRSMPASRIACLAVALGLSVLPLTATQAQSGSKQPGPAAAAAPAQPVYKTPEEASQALLDAVQRQDAQRLKELLGEASLVETDQPELDVLERKQFVEKYQRMHRLAHRTDGSYVLKIGPENWPFPVPIVQDGGAWRFDSGEGLREVVFRRIGENELTAIEVCHALVDAKHGPAVAEPVPAANEEDAGSLVTRVLATHQAGVQPVRFHGYLYRVVPRTDGHFFVVAYPAEYRSSGVVTFVVGEDDVVYEKDLGDRTVKAAQGFKDFHRTDNSTQAKGAGWRRAEDEVPSTP